MRIRIRLLMPVLMTAALLSEMHSQWVQTNGPFGAPVLSFAANGKNLFAGTDQGVSRSTDSGATWTSVTLPPPDIRALVFVNNSLFAGTRGGLYVSTDTGTTWRVGHWYYRTEIISLCVHQGNLFAGSSTDGVFRSTDLGTSWTQQNYGIDRGYISAFATIGPYVFLSAPGTNGGVYRSDDEGETWTRIDSGLTHFDVRALAVGGTKLFAGADGGSVFRSTDYGSSWTEVDIGSTDKQVTALALSGSTLYAGTNGAGVYRSTDDGASWIARSSGLTDNYVNALVVIGGNFFAGTVDGVFCSTDNTASWSERNAGLPYRTVNALALSDSGTTIFAGATEAGVYRSRDNGATWEAPNTGLKLYNGNTADVLALIVNGTYIFAGTNGEAHVYRSVDNGATWNESGAGLPLQRVQSFGLSSQSLFVGMYGGGVYRSSDNGMTWAESDVGIPTNVTVNAFALNEQVLFAATGGWGVYRSSDNGQSWTAANTGLPTPPWVESLAVFPAAAGKNNLVLGSEDGIYLSTDNGENWTAIDRGLPQHSQVNALASTASALFAGTSSHGVYLSTNSGTSWISGNQALTDSTVNAFVLSPSGSNGKYLFAGTSSSGVFRYPTNSSPVASIVPLVQAQVDAGAPFWVEVRVGNPKAITGLYGISLKLKSSKPSCAYVDGSATVLNSDFMGANVLSVFHKDDLQTVEMGLTKTATPGADGSGVIARAVYACMTPGPVQFSLADVVALESHGTMIVLDTASAVVNVNTPTPTVKPVPEPPYSPGNAFWIHVRVGDPSIYGLYRISFKLKSDKATCTYVDGSASYEGFLGFGPNMTITNVDAQTVGIEIIRNAAWGGVNGSGYVARVQFMCPSTGTVHFTLSDVIARDKSGATIPVDVRGGAITVTSSIRRPILARKIPALTPVVSNNAPAFFCVSASDPNDLPLTYIWKVDGDTKQVGDSTFLWTFSQPSGSVLPKMYRSAPSVTCVFQDQGGLEDSTVWSSVTTHIQDDRVAPTQYSLCQNYPNPFNPSTTIRYDLPKSANVNLKIFNTLGQEVALLVNERKEAGFYQATWNANVPSGIYFYRLQAGEFVETKKMILLK